jgi:hypothetical protein
MNGIRVMSFAARVDIVLDRYIEVAFGSFCNILIATPTKDGKVRKKSGAGSQQSFNQTRPNAVFDVLLLYLAPQYCP